MRVLVPHGPDGRPGADQVVLRSVRDGEPLVREAALESTDATGSWWRSALPVENLVTNYRFLLSTGAGGYAWLNGTGVHARDVTDAADFRIVTTPPPEWVADQVGYQVFPDRFARSGARYEAPGWARPSAWDEPVQHDGAGTGRQWFGGDLDGIAAHLDHLTELGATLLYLTPVFEASSNHRYDAISFDHVDPVLGGDEALRRLLSVARRAGVRVIGDLTTNHTGRDHAWFREAVAHRDSAEAGFYRFRGGSDDYHAWLDVPSLPKLDHASPELRRRLYEGDTSVVARWLDAGREAGFDGWRIDVANMTGRLGADDLAHEVARSVRTTATARNPDAWLLAEHGHDASLDLRGDGWHGTMDYAGFTRPVWSWLNGGSPGGPGAPHGLQFLGLPVAAPVLPGQASVATMREVHAAMPWQAWVASTSHLDSHDTPRFRTVVGGGTDGRVDAAGQGRPRHIVGLGLQMTLPGVPVVFMGDELGLTGVDGEHARTPMPWDRPQSWDRPTLDAYRTWIRLRRDHLALRRGGLRWVFVGADAMTFLREHPEERVLVHAARAGHAPVQLPLELLGLRAAQQLVPLHGEPVREVRPGTVALPADGPAAHAWAVID